MSRVHPTAVHSRPAVLPVRPEVAECRSFRTAYLRRNISPQCGTGFRECALPFVQFFDVQRRQPVAFVESVHLRSFGKGRAFADFPGTRFTLAACGRGYLM